MSVPLRAAAIIPAAGSGTRSGLSSPKVLFPLGGTTPLHMASAAVLSDPRVRDVYVAVPTDQMSLFVGAALPERVTLVPGGETRAASVRACLERVAAAEPRAELVIVHDAARCFVSPGLVARCLDAAALHGACTAAIPVVDTLVAVGEGNVAGRLIDRDGCRAVQTPQAFRTELLLSAHREAGGAPTDDATLVGRFVPVVLVEGDTSNFKVTTPGDLRIARALVGDCQD